MNISPISNKKYFINLQLPNLTKTLKNNNIFYYIKNKLEGKEKCHTLTAIPIRLL
jgi:hypothetical protein